jgi:hypothetical protein
LLLVQNTGYPGYFWKLSVTPSIFRSGLQLSTFHLCVLFHSGLTNTLICIYRPYKSSIYALVRHLVSSLVAQYLPASFGGGKSSKFAVQLPLNNLAETLVNYDSLFFFFFSVTQTQFELYFSFA